MSEDRKKGCGTILVVEDDPVVRRFIEAAINRTDCKVTSVGDGKAALTAIDKEKYDLVITDLKVPAVNGIKVLEYVKKKQPDTSVVIGTAFGSIENAVEAMRKGAFDYLTKPFSVEDILEIVDRVIGYKRRQNNNSPTTSSDGSSLIGVSHAINYIRSLITMIAPSKTTVLIEGETGVGKEVVADALQQMSNRREKPFIKVNCAALPDTLVESELFGFEKGAFTGAHARTKGRFELADSGTLLLDEIGEMSLHLQAKLLRVLQSKKFERLGSGQSIEVDVRVIATTNRDLKEEVKQNKFRKDLYFRLNVVKITVPPLRSHKDDIAPLARHFLDMYCRENEVKKSLSQDALEKLMDYDWPGNVRELQNTIEKAVVITPREIIKAENLHFVDEYRDLFEYLFSSEDDITIYEAEKQLILTSLKRNSYNKTKTADALGITVKTLRNKLKEYGELVGEENS
jgi:two-component system response regulator AtoC